MFCCSCGFLVVGFGLLSLVARARLSERACSPNRFMLACRYALYPCEASASDCRSRPVADRFMITLQLGDRVSPCTRRVGGWELRRDRSSITHRSVVCRALSSLVLVRSSYITVSSRCDRDRRFFRSRRCGQNFDVFRVRVVFSFQVRFLARNPL